MERFSDLNETVYYEDEDHDIERVYGWYDDIDGFLDYLKGLQDDYSQWNGDYCDTWGFFEDNGFDDNQIHDYVEKNLRKVLDDFECLRSSTITLYRLVEVKDEDDVDRTELGRHWSISMDGVLGFIKNQGSYDGYKKCVLVGRTEIENIDWASRTLQFMNGYSFENEYPVVNDYDVDIVEEHMFDTIEEVYEWARSLQ